MRSFSLWVTAALALGPAWSRAADCNRNGIDDRLDIQEVAPSFQFETQVPIAAAELLRASDMDADGDADLVVLNPQRVAIQIYSNEAGLFSWADVIPLTEMAKDLVVEDLDGDGDGDVAFTRRFGVQILWNDERLFANQTSFVNGSFPVQLVAADVEGDGDMDLISGNPPLLELPTASISLLENEGGRVFRQARNFASPIRIGRLAAADVDGDGDVDIAGASGVELIILENDGLSRFSLLEKPIRLPSALDVLISGDIDRDGARELIGLGDSMFVIAKTRGRTTDLRSHPIELHGALDAVTVNRDDDSGLDLVVSKKLCRGLVAMKVAAAAVFQRPLHERGAMLAPADFDRDGDLDLAATPETDSPAPLLVGIQRLLPVAHDCDGDGVPDECQTDCDRNGIADACDVAVRDCNSNGLPDGCDQDCNENGLPDDCDIAQGTADDCNANWIPDSCEAEAMDRDRDGVLDDCEILGDPRLDCNGNGLLDSIDVRRRLQFGHETYPVTTGDSVHLAAADLDRDGDLDLAAAGGRHLRGLDNASDGSFSARNVAAFEGNIISLAFTGKPGDANTDMALLLSDAACSHRRSIHFLRGEGNWVFSRRQNVHVIESGVDVLTAGDLNDDGELDLVASRRDIRQEGPAGIWALFQREGVFEPPSRLAEGGGEVILADLDGDGSKDLAASWGMVLLGSSDGRFRRAKEDLPRSGYTCVKEGDLDRDGRIDLVLAGLAHHAAIFMGRGNGTFELRGETPAWFGVIELQDFNQDGLLDLAVPSRTGVSVHLNGGNGLLGEPQSCSLPGGFADIISGDVDLDGDPDLLTSSSSVQVLRNEGDGRFRCSTRAPTRGEDMLRAADLDGDGDLDLAAPAGGAWTSVIFEENDGQGSFSSRFSEDIEGWARGFLIRDLTGNPLPDLCKALANEALVFENKGDWSFELVARLEAGPASAGLLVEAMDVDRDGDADLLLVNDVALSLFVFMNQGRGAFTLGSTHGIAGPVARLHAADLDGNGLEDVVFGMDGKVQVWRHMGDQAFRTADAFSAAGHVQTIESGDLDGDGTLDLVLATAPTECPPGIDCPRFVALFNRGDGTFHHMKSLGDGRPWKVALADLDSDGDLDIAAGIRHPGVDLIVLENDGKGNFHEAATLGRFLVSSLLAEDVDGNGIPDLVFIDDLLRRNDSFHLNVALNRSPGPTSRDMDGDGVPDECLETRFSRGDADQSGAIDISDPVFVLDHLFRGGLEPGCLDAADAGDDGLVNLLDPILELLHLFGGIASLPKPFGSCGLDGTRDALGCQRFGPCE